MIDRNFETQNQLKNFNLHYKGLNIGKCLLVWFYLHNRKCQISFRSILGYYKRKLLHLADKPSIRTFFVNKKIHNLNAYIINFSPRDKRHFLHIANIVDRDSNAVVLTINKEVYKYYENKKTPTVLFMLNERPMESVGVDSDFKIGLTAKSLLFRCAVLVDLLNDFTTIYGMPQHLITLQDFHCWDSVFATFYKSKIPTITLQHGLANEKELWSSIISDYIIVWGTNQKQKLLEYGVDPIKIKTLGTAKYDSYIHNTENKRQNCRVLVGIQNHRPTRFQNKIINLLLSTSKVMKSTEFSIRFHPSMRNIDKAYFHAILKSQRNLDNINVSKEPDPMQDIANSDILLANNTGLAVEAMLLNKIVIEYFPGSLDNYQSNVQHVWNSEELVNVLKKIKTNGCYTEKLLLRQKESVNRLIEPLPAGQRILNFINSL